MQKRFAIFLILAATILFGWSFVMEKYFVAKPPPNVAENPPASPASPASVATSSSPTALVTPTAPTPTAQETTPSAAPALQVAARQIELKTSFWKGTLSNQGGVITEWAMTHFTDDVPIDEKESGVKLVPKISQEIGFPLRLFIPSDPGLEKELNSAAYVVENVPEKEASIEIGKSGQQEVVFSYSNNGVTARKKFVFDGSGYDLDLQIEVTRNDQPVETYVVIGPNFGDQSIKEYGYYKPAPQVSYAVDGSVKRQAAASLKEAEHPIPASPITWAAVDDSYFAMALVLPPATPARTITVLNHRRREKIGAKEEDRNYISVAVPVGNGQTNHLYAGPKDPETLAAVSGKFGLKSESGNLEGLVNYGFLSFVVKPLASVMLKALLIINRVIGNYGWSIVALTIVLNMLFFPMRWKSSVSMKRTAAMQPKMKDLQERMKKLDKNDPRMAELQREQISLMREGNPLMGCLPLLLQLPFFYAVFSILTISIEVRHAPFFGWIHDLSSPDQYWILPIVMCVSMIVQTALTPSTADPIQKKMGYFMPLLFTGMFFIYAPAGLVLYWMVGNLVGIAQQMIINRLSPPSTPATTNSAGRGGGTLESKKDQAKPQLPKGKKSKELLANS